MSQPVAMGKGDWKDRTLARHEPAVRQVAPALVESPLVMIWSLPSLVVGDVAVLPCEVSLDYLYTTNGPAVFLWNKVVRLNIDQARLRCLGQRNIPRRMIPMDQHRLGKYHRSKARPSHLSQGVQTILPEHVVAVSEPNDISGRCNRCHVSPDGSSAKIGEGAWYSMQFYLGWIKFVLKKTQNITDDLIYRIVADRHRDVAFVRMQDQRTELVRQCISIVSVPTGPCVRYDFYAFHNVAPDNW